MLSIFRRFGTLQTGFRLFKLVYYKPVSASLKTG